MYRKCHLFYYDVANSETIFMQGGKEIGKIKNKPMNLIEKWCLENGSTIEGRMKSFRYMLNVVQKPPIMVSERQRIIFIPTTSCTCEDCIFIQYQSIVSLSKANNRGTKISMKDGSKYIVPVDIRTMKRQFKRTAAFLHEMNLNSKFFLVLEVD